MNLYTGLSWLTRESKKDDAALTDVPLTELCEKDKDNHEDSNSGIDDDDNDNEMTTSCTNDDIVDNDDEDNDDISYSVSTGNTGLVFVNNLIDYINRPDQLKGMCWYEFNEKVYKQKYNADDKKKNDKILDEIAKNKENPDRILIGKKKKRGPPKTPKYYFKPEHPQSETHWLALRNKENELVPALSKIPPNINTDKLKFQKSMLLLFKPFLCYIHNDPEIPVEETLPIYNGYSWNETYESTIFKAPYCDYVQNIIEMHKGLKEREDARDEDDDTETNDVVDEVDEELDLDSIDVTAKEIDTLTTNALDVIAKKTQWLQQSVNNDQTNQTCNDRRPSQPNNQWKKELERQNDAILNNDDEDECVTLSLIHI